MPRQPASLMRRLLIDSVLPCALAALILTGLLTLHRVHSVDDLAHRQIGMQLEQLADALDRSTESATQGVLDDALRAGGPVALQRVELEEPDGRQFHSGTSTTAPFERYRRQLPTEAGNHRTLTVHVNAQPRQHEKQLAWMYGGLSGLGIVLLVLLAAAALHQRVLMPMQRLQHTLDALLARDDAGATPGPEPRRDFARLQASATALAGRLQAHRLDQASTRRATAIDALDQLRQSQAASRSKSQFMALVGHHFRQPLQALQLFVASLHPGIDAEQQALLMQMRASVAAMTRLLDALLEISQLDAGVMTVTARPFSVTDLFLSDRAGLAEDARQYGVTLIWRSRPCQIVGDAELTCSLLRQLVSNAIVHAGPRARVLIAARRSSHGVRIEVRDNGPGIATIHQQRIFEEFVQLHGEAERSDGYGLGLAIAARLARVLGTEIGLRSEVGLGSTFSFELPCMPRTLVTTQGSGTCSSQRIGQAG